MALRVIPADWTNPEDFPEDFPQHTARTLAWANAWMTQNDFTEDEVRHALVTMDPLLAKRLLRSERRQEDAIYNAIQREGLKHGDVSFDEVGRNIARFGGVA